MCMSYLSTSTSPFSCFIRRLCCSRTVTSTPRSRLHRLRRAHQTQMRSTCATPHVRRRVWLTSFQSSTKPLLWTVTRRPATVRTTMASLTSREPRTRTLDCSVFPQCSQPLFRTFLMVTLLFREEAKKARLWKPLQGREKGVKEKVLRSVFNRSPCSVMHSSRAQRKLTFTSGFHRAF